MKKILYTIVAGIIVIGGYFIEENLKNKNKTTEEEFEVYDDVSGFDYLPTSTTNSIVKHQYYSLSYSEKHEQAEWVAYELKSSQIKRNDFKRPYFKIDRKVKTKAAHWRNYKNSGYDRGHLCPAGDRGFSKQAYNETFLTSNISPQIHNFNAGVWNELEQKTRRWAKKEKQLFIVTGPVFENTNTTIGTEHVTVPTHFYKIILKYGNGKPKCIAFLIPHKIKSQSYKNYIVTVDELEKKLGIDFFPALEDDVENRLEANYNTGFSL